MALVYLVNKRHVSRRIARWLLLFLEYDFTIVYKPCKTHVVVDASSRLLDITKPIDTFDQTIDVNIFFTEPRWLNDVKAFLRIG
jgi:hypothetical protein